VEEASSTISSHSIVVNNFLLYALVGAISQILAAQCKSILGIDINQQAVDLYNQQVINQGLSSHEMKAIYLDIVAQPTFIRDRFNVIVVCRFLSKSHFFKF
jgi:2-polyprenyl-3-methyl-5-hydroxy-6-metoxy-1,4-benzoquinol methylase